MDNESPNLENRSFPNIKETRKALRMSSKQLAKNSGKAASTLCELENREAEGRITIKSLQDIAESLGCDFIYEFKPKNSIAETLLNQAKKQIRIELEKDIHHYTDEYLEEAAIQLLTESKYLDWSQ